MLLTSVLVSNIKLLKLNIASCTMVWPCSMYRNIFVTLSKSEHIKLDNYKNTKLHEKSIQIIEDFVI